MRAPAKLHIYGLLKRYDLGLDLDIDLPKRARICVRKLKRKRRVEGGLSQRNKGGDLFAQAAKRGVKAFCCKDYGAANAGPAHCIRESFFDRGELALKECLELVTVDYLDLFHH
ncbi:MAG: hypothetical protein JFAIHJKO_02855 [Pyrinomonadaceae bacterium]|nr:hypothetical protein [Pyrinomonadaceae bacterium]